MAPELELKPLQIGTDLVHIVVLPNDAKEQDKDRILGVYSRQLMIPAFIDKDEIVPKSLF
jgi:hypothetical protein